MSSKNSLLAPSGRFRAPNSRRIEFFGSFLAPLWILRAPKIIQNRLSGAKREWKSEPQCCPGGLLEPTSSRVHFGSHFGCLLDDFSCFFNHILGYLFMIIYISFWLCFLFPFPLLLFSVVLFLSSGCRRCSCRLHCFSSLSWFFYSGAARFVCSCCNYVHFFMYLCSCCFAFLCHLSHRTLPKHHSDHNKI